METIRILPFETPISRICLGTWAIGGRMWNGTNEKESIKTIHKALTKGINIIDTAPIYGLGRSEEIIGKAIKEYGGRDKIIIANKAGLSWDNNNQIYRDSSPNKIEIEINSSLKRLGTDYIDLYQIHWPDRKVRLEDTAESLLKLIENGKIRAIGVSNFNNEQIERFNKIAPIHTSQLPYNLFERKIETSSLPFTEKNNIPTLAYGALCRGLLTGKFDLHPQFKGDDIRKHDPKFNAPHLVKYINAVKSLEAFSQSNYQKNIIELSVRWILDKGKTIALWGARSPQQLDNIEGVMGWNINEDAMKAIDNIISSIIIEPIGVEFMAPPE